MHRHRPLQTLSARRPIIALAPLALLCALGTAEATGNGGASGTGATPVPPVGAIVPVEPTLVLGNTAEGDRPLLREIGDDHVHEPSGPLVEVTAGPPAGDVWDRVRTAGRLVVPDNDIVRAQTAVFRDEALWIGKILRRATPFAAHLVAALEARFLPPELALLPAIESGFRPHALSHRQAAGLWQIIPRTAREIGIPRTEWYDGRTDVIASTTAALDYLSELNAVFHGDWELTLAAYNAGPGRVRRAIRRNRAAGLPTDFWSLGLPSETRAYVPKLLALLALLREGNDALDIPSVPLEPAFAKVDVGQRISLDRAATLGAVSARLLRQLNAGLVRGVTPPAGPHELYVPSAAREDFLRRMAAAEPGPAFFPPSTHVVVAGDTLGALALAYGVSQERLMSLNGLDGPAIRTGQTLAVLDARHANGASVEHVVASGDTLSDIASRYAVDLEAITDREGRALRADLIRPGERLLVNLVAPGSG